MSSHAKLFVAPSSPVAPGRGFFNGLLNRSFEKLNTIHACWNLLDVITGVFGSLAILLFFDTIRMFTATTNGMSFLLSLASWMTGTIAACLLAAGMAVHSQQPWTMRQMLLVFMLGATALAFAITIFGNTAVDYEALTSLLVRDFAWKSAATFGYICGTSAILSLLWYLVEQVWRRQLLVWDPIALTNDRMIRIMEMLEKPDPSWSSTRHRRRIAQYITDIAVIFSDWMPRLFDASGTIFSTPEESYRLSLRSNFQSIASGFMSYLSWLAGR